MNEAMNCPPFSQCVAKGRCLRHPTIQMSKKKKLGGWKKLLGICPLCAMEMLAEDRRASSEAASRPRETVPSDTVSLHSRSSAGRRQRRAPRVGHHDHDDDARSVGTRQSAGTHADRSVMSAPAVPYGHGRGLDRGLDDPRSSHSSSCSSSSHRHRPSRSKSNRGSLSSDSLSSCDTTVDLSYSSEYSGSSRRSRRSHHSHGRRTPPRQEQAPRRDVPPERQDPRDDEGEFVCGMELFVDDRTRCFYTGQIHAGTQLPHGLGTLRSDVDGSMIEGSWEHGRLVQENGEASSAPPPPPPGDSPSHRECGGQPDFVSPMDSPEAYPRDRREGDYQEEYQQGYQQECQQECQEGDYDYCHPCAPTQDQHPDADYQDGHQDEYEESLSRDFEQCQVDDYDSFGQGDGPLYAGSSDDSSSAAGSAASGYSAREQKKSSLPPPDGHGRGHSRRGEHERVRRVRFQEDP